MWIVIITVPTHGGRALPGMNPLARWRVLLCPARCSRTVSGLSGLEDYRALCQREDIDAVVVATRITGIITR